MCKRKAKNCDGGEIHMLQRDTSDVLENIDIRVKKDGPHARNDS